MPVSVVRKVPLGVFLMLLELGPQDVPFLCLFFGVGYTLSV